MSLLGVYTTVVDEKQVLFNPRVFKSPRYIDDAQKKKKKKRIQNHYF
jgi:hypothetical protein